jgi:hypothetical protein
VSAPPPADPSPPSSVDSTSARSWTRASREPTPAPANLPLTEHAALAAIPGGGAWLAWLTRDHAGRTALVYRELDEDGALGPAYIIAPLSGAPSTVAIAARRDDALIAAAVEGGREELALYVQRVTRAGAGHRVFGVLSPSSVYAFRGRWDGGAVRGVSPQRALSVVPTPHGFALTLPAAMDACEGSLTCGECAPLRVLRWLDDDRFELVDTERKSVDDARPALLAGSIERDFSALVRSRAQPVARVVGDGPLTGVSLASDLRPLASMFGPDYFNVLASRGDAQGARSLVLLDSRYRGGAPVPVDRLSLRCENAMPVNVVSMHNRGVGYPVRLPSGDLLAAITLTVAQFPGSDGVDPAPATAGFDPVVRAVWTGRAFISLRRSGAMFEQRCDGAGLSAPIARNGGT